MFRRWLFAVLFCAIGLGYMLSATTASAEPFGHLRKHFARKPPDYLGNPKIIAPGPPGLHRYPEYNTGSYPSYGYGFGVSTYNWGYFGVPYRAYSSSHKGYYGHSVQWGYRRGY